MEFTACSFFMLSDGWCDSTTVSVAEVFHGFNRFGGGVWGSSAFSCPVQICLQNETIEKEMPPIHPEVCTLACKRD